MTLLALAIGVAIITSLLDVSRTAVRYHRHQDYRERFSGDEAAYQDHHGRAPAEGTVHRPERWRGYR